MKCQVNFRVPWQCDFDPPKWVKPIQHGFCDIVEGFFQNDQRFNRSPKWIDLFVGEPSFYCLSIPSLIIASITILLYLHIEPWDSSWTGNKEAPGTELLDILDLGKSYLKHFWSMQDQVGKMLVFKHGFLHRKRSLDDMTHDKSK